MTIAGYSFQRCLIPETVVLLGIIPVTPYATPASLENRDAISQLICQHDAILLAYHGSLTVAEDVWKAYLRLESLEHTAKILYMVEQLGGAKQPIPPDQIEKLLKVREQLGLARPGDAQRFFEACGVIPAENGHLDGKLEGRIRAIVREVLAELYSDVLS
jgi:L-fuculose-phosphate aldolase